MTPGLLQTAQEPDVGTAVVTVVGAVMLGALGLRLAYLALRTRATVTDAQAALWEYFGYAGVVAVLYAGLVLVGHAGDRSLPFLDGLLLALGLCFALATREAHYNATLSNAEVDRLGQFRLRRAVEVALVGTVVVTAVGPLLRPSPRFALLSAAAGLAVVAYGLGFQLRRRATGAGRGTIVDALVRQSLPVLVFVGAALLTPALAPGPVSEPVARALVPVFVLLAAASLLPLTRQLGQHRSALA